MMDWLRNYRWDQKMSWPPWKECPKTSCIEYIYLEFKQARAHMRQGSDSNVWLEYIFNQHNLTFPNLPFSPTHVTGLGDPVLRGAGKGLEGEARGLG